MKKQIVSLSLALLTASGAQAARVAVVDSGTDFQHAWLKNHAWLNEKEIAGNRVDDDNNGKVDDVSGWNFADSYGRVFFPEHLQLVNPITYRLFEIIAHQQAGRTTDEDKKFWEEHVLSLPKPRKEALTAHLNFFGQYAHGTHVAGIVASQDPEAKIMAARVFADEPPAEYGKNKGWSLSEMFYKLLAMASNGTFDLVAGYLHERQADVANYSLGVPLHSIAKQVLALRGVKEPTAAELSAETKLVFGQFEPRGRAWMTSAPHTLFVIAAGNDGNDNDALPMFPASIRVENAVSVAATQDFDKLAKFSNYGKLSVDVAAPGVAIVSSVPGLDAGRTLPMSGTSMAAPYVTGVAARIKSLNPGLNPVQIKEVLMGTVDRKDWLQDKVISAGIVNAQRAYVAAEKSRQQALSQAIAESRALVADQVSAPAPAASTLKSIPADLRRMADSLVF
ncbi:MAG: S8 family serine peptidase [Bdellovibrionaceae bacterium]|nr:S8 family serine peptidase [Pseudobdellovibrionaceae bacterium]